VNEWRENTGYIGTIIQPRDQSYVNATTKQTKSSGSKGYHGTGSSYHYDRSYG